MKEVQNLKTGRTVKGSSKPDLRHLAAFLITLLCYLFLAIIGRKYPFGDFSVDISDLSAQYAPFLAMLRNKILSLGSSDNLISALTYSSQSGLGKNFKSTYGYYLSSPFNVLYALLDVTQIETFILFLMFIKMSLASAFMSRFIAYRTDDDTRLPVLFGVLYAFTSYTVAYLFQIMWLDGYMLLPLLLYFVEKFVRKGKCTGIIVTLIWLFLSNYYTAYMVGIFSFVYLLARLYTLGLLTREAKVFGRVGKFIYMAVACALTLCVILVPVALDTITNADKTLGGDKTDYVKYNAVDAFDRLLNGIPGDFADILPSNLPWLYTGTLITALVICYLVSGAFKGREKKVHTAGLIFFYVSTAIGIVDVMWQAFDSPNWFWHRHVFVFYPMLFIIAVKAFKNIASMSVKDIRKAFVIHLAILFVAQALGSTGSEEKNFIYNLAFICAVYLILLLMKKENWHPQLVNMPKLLPFILSLVVVFESVYVGPLLSSGVATLTLAFNDAPEYMNSIAVARDFGDVVKVLGPSKGVYRGEFERAFNYSDLNNLGEGEEMYGNYNGVSFFHSSSNKYLHRFLKQFGYDVNYNYFSESYSYAAPSTDAFLSVGAVSSLRDYKYGDFTVEDPLGMGTGFTYYLNKNVLPVIFETDKSALDFDFYQLEKKTSGKDYFKFQNDWYRSMFPEFEEDFFLPVEKDQISVEYKNTIEYDPSDYKLMAEIKKSERIATDSSLKARSESADKLAGDDGAPSDKDPLGQEPLKFDDLKTFYRMNEDIPMIIEYKFKAPNDKELYANFVTGTTLNGMVIYVNNIAVHQVSDGTFFSNIVRLGSFKEGDEVTVSVLADTDRWSLMDLNIGYFDYDSFTSQFEKIDKSGVNLEKASEGYFKATADVKEGKTLITSIPYEKGWTLKVDGQVSEIKPYQQAFIAIDCGPGKHDIELEFTAPGLKPGAMMSLAGIVMLAGFAIFSKKKKAVKKIEKT